MVIAEFNILASFYCFNEQYFGGILPIPNLKVRHGWRTLGYFWYQTDAPFGMSETIASTIILNMSFVIYSSTR